MKPKMKLIGLGIVLVMIISLLAVLIIMDKGDAKGKGEVTAKVEAPKPVTKERVKKKKVSVKAGAKVRKKSGFNTNEEIKKRYGRIERVTLYDGRSFTGAVISVNDFYSIVTTEGTKKIRMNDVKERIFLE
jgi:hypothetical protein